MSDNEMDLDASGDSVVTAHDMDYRVLNSHFESNQVSEQGQIELSNALHVVSVKLPQVSWKTVADAMAMCVKYMPRGSKNDEVIKFVQDCMFQILHVMISLNAIDGNPRTLTALQDMWKEETFVEFNRCFHMGLSDAVRTMVRIGAVCSVDELKAWHDWEYNKQRHSTWVNSLEVLMDVEQAAYLSEDPSTGIINPGANSLWEVCSTAFFEEGGFNVLYSLLDPNSFNELPADKVVDREQVLHCKIARMLKRIVGKHLMFGAPHMPDGDEILHAMQAVETLSEGALEWLKGRFNTSPDKLTQLGKSKDTELIDCLTELIGPELSLGLAKELLSTSSLGAQQAGLRLARELRKQGGEMGQALGALPHDFLKTLQKKLSGTGESLVKQLVTMKVVAKRAIVDTFEELAMLMELEEDKFKVCMFWGDIGLRCMCTADDRTREIGIGLLDSLSVSQPHFKAQELAPAAIKALNWLKQVCGQTDEAAEFNMSKSLEKHGLKECERLTNFLTTIHHVLMDTGCVEEAETVATIWMDTAIRCLRALDKYPVREMGLQMVQEAIRFNSHNYSVNEKYGGAAAHRGKLGRGLIALVDSQEGLKAVLDSLFSEKYAHHAVIRLASTWLVDTYYREHCYEDELVDLMAYLVEAAVHPEWGVVEPVTDLLVRVTVTNISIKSLNSLCNLFKGAVSDKSTAAAGNSLILTWIDKTRQKKWVIGVQERVLNLLWTMLVNKSSENEDDTVKVLDYFKNQFSNIRGHASSDWAGGERQMSDKELTARHCILTCATDCLAEIRRSGLSTTEVAGVSKPVKSDKAKAIASSLSAEPEGFPPLVRSPSNYEPDEMRSRASQSASLLNIVLNLVDNLRPDVLREMHGSESPGEMVGALLEEALSSATFSDVEPSAIFMRLQLIANISSYMLESSPLTTETIKSIWNNLFVKSVRHRKVCLRWLNMVLRPKELASDMVYFKPIDSKSKKGGDDAAVARKFILEQLGALVTGSKVSLEALGKDGVDCLLSLFLWVNRDQGALEEADKTPAAVLSYGQYAAFSSSVSSSKSTTSSAYMANAALPLYADEDEDEIEDVVVRGEEILCFEALTTAALDSDPSHAAVVFPACRSLLKVSAACYRARKVPMEVVSEGWNLLPKSKSKSSITLGLERYDLVESIFSRIDRLQALVAARSKDMSYTTEEAAKLNHWLAVLHHFLEDTSVFNVSTSHAGSSVGEEMLLSIACEVEVAPKAGSSESTTERQMRSVVVHQHTTLLEAINAATEAFFDNTELSSTCSLRRAAPANQTANQSFQGNHRTMEDLGILSKEQLILVTGENQPVETVVLPSPAEQLSGSDKYLDVLFGLLNNTDLCQNVWAILQMSPSSSSALKAIADPTRANWPALVSSSASQGLWRRVYTCQLVEANLLPASSTLHEQVAEWRRGFLSAGGLKAVLSMLDGQDLTTMPAQVRRAALAPLLRVVNLCVCSSITINTNKGEDEDDDGDMLRRFSVGTAELVKQTVDLREVMELLFSVIRIGNSAQALSESEVAAVSNSMATVTTIMRGSDQESWDKVSSSFPLDVLLRLLLESAVPRLRKEAAATFKELLAGEKDYTLYSDKSSKPCDAANVLGPLFFGEKLTSLSLDCCTATEFFSVCNTLLDVAGSWLNPHEIRLSLQAKVNAFATCVPRVNENDGSDSVLVGTMSVLARVLALDPASPAEADQLVKTLLTVFLMRLPDNAKVSKTSLKGSAVRAWESGPVCGTIASREKACEVLEACAVSEALQLRVLDYFSTFAGLTRPPPPESAFLVSRAADEIKELERPGLNNTANRCYMNSLCQQLTALDGFSAGLLSAPVPASVLEADAKAAKEKAEAGDEADAQEPLEGTWDCPVCTFQNDVNANECSVCESLKPANVKIVAAGADPEVERKEVEAKAKAHKFILREMQRTVRFLKQGEMRCYDAEPLLECVGKHLALQFPAEQQNDTKEFMDKLLDRLEIELGDTVAKDLVKENFGATTAETKVRQHDGKLVNRNTTTMTTYTLGLQVEGVGSLEEAIETNLAPNIREVDDDDEKDENGKPVKHKFEYGTRFVHLPEVLCVQLSRFSFDYSRGVPIKHNHRVSFPMELNMGKWTESGKEVGPESRHSTLYRLRGCLVHLGPSANQGHYYSIIRSAVDPEVFLKFNDNHVSPADSIEDECFGGERAAGNGSKYSHEKNWNAYLLFYERVRDDVSDISESLAKLSMNPEGARIREMQESEVIQSNADLWRRKLLYQRPLLNLSRKLLVQGAPTAQPSSQDIFSQAGLTLFGHGVLHCSDFSSNDAELADWVNALGLVLNETCAVNFLTAVAAGEASNADDEDASKQLNAAVQASMAQMPAETAAWTSVPLLSRSILQVGSRVSAPAVREATAKLIAMAANKATNQIALEALVVRLLAALAQLYSDKDLLDGFVIFIHELAKFDRLHAVLHRLDLPALLIHIYFNQASPLNGWAETEGVCAANGIVIPKLGSNTRRGTSSSYAQVMHDFKRLLRALACLLKSSHVDLAPLSARALFDASFVSRLVERDPLAGVEPAQPRVRTNEEVMTALAEEGWRHVVGLNGGKGYWVRDGYKNSYTVERPTPKAQSITELEDEGFQSAQPKDLLLVSLALARGSAMQGLVLDALLEGIETSVTSNWLAERRIDALSMLLRTNEDGQRANRIEASHTSLRSRIDVLRLGTSPAVKALKNLAQCTRMEVLTNALKRVRTEGGDVLGNIPPEEGLKWVEEWLEQRRPQLRVTLKDLQGAWTNNQNQAINVLNSSCTFASSEPVMISQDAETGTFTVPGWSLVQEQSWPGNVLWRSNNTRETTRWTRVQVTAQVLDDDDDDLYNENIQNAHTL